MTTTKEQSKVERMKEFFQNVHDGQMLSEKVIEIADKAIKEMSSVNPHRLISHKQMDWVIENFMDICIEFGIKDAEGFEDSIDYCFMLDTYFTEFSY